MRHCTSDASLHVPVRHAEDAQQPVIIDDVRVFHSDASRADGYVRRGLVEE